MVTRWQIFQSAQWRYRRCPIMEAEAGLLRAWRAWRDSHEATRDHADEGAREDTREDGEGA